MNEQNCLQRGYLRRPTGDAILVAQARPGARRVVFVHTGGMLGLYAKEAQLERMLAPIKTNRKF